MSKKTVTIEVFECDHVDGNGVRCANEGPRQAIKECALCRRDLCSRHYEMLSVTRMGGMNALTYFFCSEHADEFLSTLIKTFGDTGPVAYAGMAK
jgi:hypothetical protein